MEQDRSGDGPRGRSWRMGYGNIALARDGTLFSLPPSPLWLFLASHVYLGCLSLPYVSISVFHALSLGPCQFLVTELLDNLFPVFVLILHSPFASVSLKSFLLSQPPASSPALLP